MAQAPRDQNFVPVDLGVSTVDGVTPIPIQMDSITGRGLVTIDIIASDFGVLAVQPAPRDQNFVPVGMGVSSVDGTTPIPILVDSRNNGVYCDVTFE